MQMMTDEVRNPAVGWFACICPLPPSYNNC